MSDHVPQIDLTAQHRHLRSAIDGAIGQVIASGRFILGDTVDAFEREMAGYLGVSHAVGVGSGLDAIRLSLQALGIGAGDEVLLPANTFIATALAVAAVGARPVLVDCRPDTFGLDATQLDRAVTRRTRAIVAVHLYGQAADMTAIPEAASRHGLVVIEDAAQAHGAEWETRMCGALGRAGCFSFYPTKNLGALGDGGLVTTSDATLAADLRVLRDYGQREKSVHVKKGTNSRLDALQAAVLQVKLPCLDAWNARRRAIAVRYRTALAVTPLVLPFCDPRATHVFHQFVVRTSERDALRRHLTACGIGTAVHYPTPIHLTEAFQDLGYRVGDFPEAERASREVLSLPMYPELPDGHIERVCEAIVKFF